MQEEPLQIDANNVTVTSMKSIRKYLLLIITLIIAAVVIYVYYEYNRKPANLIDIKATANVEAADLISIYEKEESKANAQYLGKAIDVTGVISDILNQQDTLVNIMLGNKNEMHRVSCLMGRNNLAKIGQYHIGDKITVRGICTGYLLDVELNRCVIIK